MVAVFFVKKNSLIELVAMWTRILRQNARRAHNFAQFSKLCIYSGQQWNGELKQFSLNIFCSPRQIILRRRSTTTSYFKLHFYIFFQSHKGNLWVRCAWNFWFLWANLVMLRAKYCQQKKKHHFDCTLLSFLLNHNYFCSLSQ